MRFDKFFGQYWWLILAGIALLLLAFAGSNLLAVDEAADTSVSIYQFEVEQDIDFLDIRIVPHDEHGTIFCSQDAGILTCEVSPAGDYNFSFWAGQFQGDGYFILKASNDLIPEGINIRLEPYPVIQLNDGI